MAVFGLHRCGWQILETVTKIALSPILLSPILRGFDKTWNRISSETLIPMLFYQMTWNHFIAMKTSKLGCFTCFSFRSIRFDQSSWWWTREVSWLTCKSGEFFDWFQFFPGRTNFTWNSIWNKDWNQPSILRALSVRKGSSPDLALCSQRFFDRHFHPSWNALSHLQILPLNKNRWSERRT